jgi:hypothetical protein
MFLVDAEARGVGGDSLQLRMQFDCEAADLQP